LLRREVLGRLAGSPEPAATLRWRYLQWAVGLAATAVVVFVLAPWGSVPSNSGSPADHSQERGAVRALPGAGFGLSGIDGDGAEYEVVESNGICREDALRIYVNRREEDYRHYFLFGVDARGAVHWYAPLPEEEESYTLPEVMGRPVAVPFEFLLKRGYSTGPLVVVGLFSDDPLAWRLVSGLIFQHSALLHESPEEGARVLADKLGSEVLPATLLTRIISCGGNQ